MDSNELNKIAGAAIGSLLVFLLLGFFSAQIFGTASGGHDHDEVLAFALDTGEDEAEAEEEAPVEVDLVSLASAADAGAGERLYNRCRACHAIEDGKNGVGPHLWNVVGREIAAVDAYAYSDALAGHGGAWEVPELMVWLENTNEVASGNKMGNSAAIDEPADRMNLIAYLNAAGDAPIDLVASAGGGEEQGAAEPAAAEVETAEADEPAQEPAAADVDEAAPQAEVAETEEAETRPAPDAAEAAPETEAAEAREADTAEAEGPAPAADTSEAAAVDEDVEVAIAPEAEAEAEAEAAEADVPPAGDGPYAAFLANATVEDGRRVFNKCRACHQVREGRNGVGPHLYGVVGRPIASVEGYRYSGALAGKEGDWTLDALMAWLENPTSWAPGTKMVYALRDEMERANVIVYLNSESDAPIELE